MSEMSGALLLREVASPAIGAAQQMPQNHCSLQKGMWK